MGLTSEDLVAVLTACSGEEVTGLGDAVMLVRQTQGSLTATLLSAWQAEGRELSPALRAELDVERARVDYYRTVGAALLSKVPGLTSVKGLEILDLYPVGWTRHLNDLDLIAERESDLWLACDLLMADGWEVDTATFSYFSGAVQVIASLRRPSDDPYDIPYGIELATFYSLGNFGAIKPLARMPEKWRAPAIKNIIMLLYERYEQPFRARDLIDVVLLHDALSDGELAALHEAVVSLTLGVEYSELISLVAKVGLPPLPDWPARRLAAPAIRARRLTRGASFFLRPVAGTGRQMQRRMITGEIGRIESRAWDMIQDHLPVPAAMSSGLLAFGLPIEGPRPEVTSTELFRKGNLAWADTPIGRFLLTIGDFVTEGQFEEISRRTGPEAPAL
jgi:hypothetical protein